TGPSRTGAPPSHSRGRSAISCWMGKRTNASVGLTPTAREIARPHQAAHLRSDLLDEGSAFRICLRRQRLIAVCPSGTYLSRAQLISSLFGLSDEQLDVVPPQGGWSVRQTIEHALGSERRSISALRDEYVESARVASGAGA